MPNTRSTDWLKLGAPAPPRPPIHGRAGETHALPTRLKFATVTATSHWRVSLKTMSTLVQSALYDHDPYAAYPRSTSRPVHACKGKTCRESTRITRRSRRRAAQCLIRVYFWVQAACLAVASDSAFRPTRSPSEWLPTQIHRF